MGAGLGMGLEGILVVGVGLEDILLVAGIFWGFGLGVLGRGFAGGEGFGGVGFEMGFFCGGGLVVLLVGFPLDAPTLGAF